MAGRHTGFCEAIGNKLGLINAEHRCLKALIDGPKTAGQLAVASGLTPAAATSMIDRLEKRGFVERQRDETDRRKVVCRHDAARQRHAGHILQASGP